MTNVVVNAESVGARLRAERESRGLNQEDFGRMGAVTRNSQAAYEAGRRACDVEYLSNLNEHGVDVAYVVTGIRLAQLGAPEVLDFADLSSQLEEEQTAALLLLARSIAHRGAKPQATAKPPIALPPIEALERGFLGVLAASQHMDEGALAHELAKRLPTMLGVLQGPLTIDRDREEDAGTPATARSERQRA